jgi:hypothetical protein
VGKTFTGLGELEDELEGRFSNSLIISLYYTTIKWRYWNREVLVTGGEEVSSSQEAEER